MAKLTDAQNYPNLAFALSGECQHSVFFGKRLLKFLELAQPSLRTSLRAGYGSMSSKWLGVPGFGVLNEWVYIP